MLNVKRLGHLTLASPDPERLTSYYTDTIGFVPVGRERDRTVLATTNGLEVIVIERGERAAASRIAMQVAPGSDLKSLAAVLSAKGFACERRSDITPGVTHSLTFRDPEGRHIDLFADYRFNADAGIDTPIMPRKLGHVAYHTPDLVKTIAFYRDVLGFRLSDQRSNFFAFLRCSRDHHSLNFIQVGNHSGLHHMAFELRDQAEISRACDFLGRQNVKLYWGPLRHIIGHNIAIYHKNPDDLSVELFSDLDIMHDEDLNYFEPRPWHQDRPQRPKIWGDDTPTNYWGPEFGPAGVGPKAN